MLIKQLSKRKYFRFFLFFYVALLFNSNFIYGGELNPKKTITTLKAPTSKEIKLSKQTLVYYLYISDFAESFIQIPTSNVSGDSSTISSDYLAGRAALYDKNNIKVGTCSASFLCMQNEAGIYTDISNYLSVDNGLIVSWLTPSKLINLELDSIINSMVTECIVTASTKIGINPLYGETFNLIVSSDDEKIYFEFQRTGTIF